MSLPKPGLPIPRNECSILGRGTRQRGWEKNPHNAPRIPQWSQLRYSRQSNGRVLQPGDQCSTRRGPKWERHRCENVCMANANKLPITAQGLAKFTTNWAAKPDNDIQARASPNIRSNLLAWRAPNHRERTDVAEVPPSPLAAILLLQGRRILDRRKQYWVITCRQGMQK